VQVAVERVASCSPRLGDRAKLGVLELGERAHVARRVDHDLLPRERGVEVRDDAHEPVLGGSDAVRLGRCPVLAALAEGTLVELGLRRLLDQPPRGARTATAVRGDDDEPPGERISPKIQRGRGTA
jgi:hypothetical protein